MMMTGGRRGVRGAKSDAHSTLNYCRPADLPYGTGTVVAYCTTSTQCSYEYEYSRRHSPRPACMRRTAHRLEACPGSDGRHEQQHAAASRKKRPVCTSFGLRLPTASTSRELTKTGRGQTGTFPAEGNTQAGGAMAGFAQDLNALSDLLDKQAKGESDAPSSVGPSPGSIGPSGVYKNINVAEPKPIKDPKEIWDPEEVEDTVEDFIEDGRVCPVYEFMYKQAVETQDTFLGLGEKDPSSTQCEDMVLRIELPGTASVRDLDLEVKGTYMKLYSIKYKLAMYLPHKIDEEKSNAKWDAKKEELRINMRIIREEIYV